MSRAEQSRVEPRVKTEVLYRDRMYALNEPLEHFIEALSTFVSMIPEDCRKDASIFIEWFEDSGIEISVSYTRPESKEERKKRLDALKKARKMGQEAAKKARFEQYKKLKAEFETPE